jgi:hypothetical protein
MMKALAIDGSYDEARRIGSCLIGSAVHEEDKAPARLIAPVGKRINDYDKSRCFIIDGRNTSFAYRQRIVVPVKTIIFDRFAAMREGIKTLFVSPNGVQHCERLISCLANENEEVTFGGYTEQEGGVFRIFTMDMIHLDVEAAALMDGVEVIDI